MFCTEINATSITSAATEINTEFNISDATFPNSYWPVTSWTLAGALFPPLLAPLIEDHGTRPGLLILYTLFSLFLIPQAVAQNFATLIVTRAVAGACGATIAAVVDGVAVDLWNGERGRGRAVVIYTFALVGGYTFGPVFGGAIMSGLGWRWIFYIHIILSFALLPALLAFFPETRAPVLLTHHAREVRKTSPKHQICSPTETPSSSSSPAHLLREALFRPTQLLFTEPVLASFTLWSSFTLGMIFMFTQSIPQVYTSLYDWSESSTGIIQIAVFIGQAVALPFCWCWNEYTTCPDKADSSLSSSTAEKAVTETQQASPAKVTSNPERKLLLSIPATLFGLAGGFFWYAWTSSSSLHWMLPSIGLGLVGFGSMAIVTAVDIYITDSYAQFAGSAIAAITFGENLVSAFLPLATSSLYNALGAHWAGSLLGFVGLGLVGAPVVLFWRGDRIRARSKFMNAGEGK